MASLCEPHHIGFSSDFVVEHQRNVFVMSPEARQSDRPTRVPIMLSTCETELEEVSGHERHECRTRTQVLILSPLQDQRGRIGKRLWTPGGSHKGHKDATNRKELECKEKSLHSTPI